MYTVPRGRVRYAVIRLWTISKREGVESSIEKSYRR